MPTSATTALVPQDYFSTTLTSDITTSTTVINLGSVPTGTEGFLVIDPDNSSKEIIFYNAAGASTVTVPSTGDRGRGGTTAVAHTSGATVKQIVAAEYYTELQNGHALSFNVATVGALSNPYKFSAWRNAAANTGNNAYAVVGFDSELFDTNNNFDITTNKGRYTAPVTGFYQFNARVATTQGSGNNLYTVALFKNGSALNYGGQSDANFMAGTISVLASLTAGDYVEVEAFAGTTLVLNVGSAAQCYFSGYLVSKT